MDINTNIGTKLQKARRGLGFTQEYVANKLGISRSKLISIEKGGNIDLGLLDQFTKLYGYGLEYFVSSKISEDADLSFAFRAVDLSQEESEILAWGNRILNNITNLDEIIKEETI